MANFQLMLPHCTLLGFVTRIKDSTLTLKTPVPILHAATFTLFSGSVEYVTEDWLGIMHCSFDRVNWTYSIFYNQPQRVAYVREFDIIDYNFVNEADIAVVDYDYNTFFNGYMNPYSAASNSFYGSPNSVWNDNIANWYDNNTSFTIPLDNIDDWIIANNNVSANNNETDSSRGLESPVGDNLPVIDLGVDWLDKPYMNNNTGLNSTDFDSNFKKTVPVRVQPIGSNLRKHASLSRKNSEGTSDNPQTSKNDEKDETAKK